MKEFVKFLLSKTYYPVIIPEFLINQAFDLVKMDYQFHFPEITEDEIFLAITSSGDALSVFLYRLGSLIHQNNIENKKLALQNLHWIMRECCSCEIYFNNKIDVGFLVVHGEGTVIGSRNEIGKGFVIHQGCTIGHKKNGMGKPSGAGCVFGNNVKVYVNSTVIGELRIGNNVIIGAHSLILEDVPDNVIISNKREYKTYQIT